MLDVERHRHGLRRFVRLRWLASIVLAGTLLAGYLRDLDFGLALPLALVSLIPVSNLVHLYVERRGASARGALLTQFGGDLVLLTGLLGALGGVDGPVLFLYLIHVILAAIFLERKDATKVMVAAAALAGLLIILQFSGAPFPRRGPGYYSTFLGIEPALNSHPLFVIGQAVMVTIITTVLLMLILPIVHESRQHRHRIESSEQEARDRIAVLENLLDNLGAMMMVLDKNHRTVWVNRVLRSRFPNLAVGEVRRCFDPAEPMGRGEPPKCPTCHVSETGEPWQGNYTLALPGITEMNVFRVYATPVPNGAGGGNIVELIIDVSGERRVEHQLLEARKTASMATIAAGVAHEMNTPLASIAVGLRTLRKACERCPRLEADPDGKLPLLLSDLVAQTTRCQYVTESILAYSRQLRSSLVAVDLEAIFHAALLDLSARRNTRGVEIVLASPGDDMPAVRCDPDHLRIILLNLFTNAIDALSAVERKKARIHVSVTKAAEANMIHIHVRDNGPGMPPEVRDHVFEPFFSTKPVGSGSGLGLPVSLGLMIGMQGALSIDTEPGEGTHVTLTLHAASGDLVLNTAQAEAGG